MKPRKIKVKLLYPQRCRYSAKCIKGYSEATHILRVVGRAYPSGFVCDDCAKEIEKEGPYNIPGGHYRIITKLPYYEIG